jgi:hypothetical protein
MRRRGLDVALTPAAAASQQHGFVHAGALAAIADSAAGYAALSLMPPGAGVLTTEFKINLLAPAAGAHSRERACHQGWSDTDLGSDGGVLPDNYERRARWLECGQPLRISPKRTTTAVTRISIAKKLMNGDSSSWTSAADCGTVMTTTLSFATGKLSHFPIHLFSDESKLTFQGKNIVDRARRENLTLRGIYEFHAGERGQRTLKGSPKRIADEMEEWFLKRGVDGFLIQPAYLPGGLNDFVELVVPELVRRGLFRSEYEGKTLRENLGLPRPASRYERKNPISVNEPVST